MAVSRAIEIAELLEAAEIIAPEHIELHARLLNWARWIRSHRHVSTAFSLEGNYRAPRGNEVDWETDTPPPSPQASPDNLDAMEIELIVRQMPDRNRKLLKLKYYARCDAKFICRRLHIQLQEYAETLFRSRQMVLNVLTRNLTVSRIRPTIRTSAQSETNGR